MRRVPVVSPFLAASPLKRLWVAGSIWAAFVLTLVVGNAFLTPAKGLRRGDLGADFLAFYTAASFVRDGRAHDLYDLPAVARAEAATAAANGMGHAFGPWWNPPVYALALEPLAALPFPLALDLWRSVNAGAVVAAAVLLANVVRRAGNHEGTEGDTKATKAVPPDSRRPGAIGRTPRRTGVSPVLWLHGGQGRDARATTVAAEVRADLQPSRASCPPFAPSWLYELRSAALVPLLVAVSMPFIQAMSHGQNTGTSLLLLTATVVLWRGGRGFAAGLVGGLLFYKPQLAAVVAAVLAVDLGWAAVGGLAVTGVALLVVTVVALPGSLTDWLHGLPANVHAMQVDRPYMWDRHVTLKAFWRLLLQGTTAGDARPLTTVLTTASVAAVAAGLAWAAVRCRGDAVRRDRLIVATVCAMPLLMPFYFDYDLLLLAVPATLYAAGGRRDRRLTGLWVALYAVLFANAPLAGATHVGVATVLLGGIAVASIRRAAAADVAAGPIPMPARRPVAMAA